MSRFVQHLATVLLLCFATFLGLLLVGPSVYPPGIGVAPFAVIAILVPLAAWKAAAMRFPKLGLFIYGALASGIYEVIFLEDTGNRMTIQSMTPTEALALRVVLIVIPIAMGFLCYEMGRRVVKQRTK